MYLFLLLKKVCHVIALILADSFNESIETGLLSDQLKLGRLIPLHKTGSKTCIPNFRPITTLFIFSKIFEKFMHCRFYSFRKIFNILIKINSDFNKVEILETQYWNF